MSAATTKRNFTDGAITVTDDGGNSATIGGLIGTFSWSGLKPGGKEQVRYEAQGNMTGDRQEARAYPSLTIEAQVARMDDDAYQIMMGTIAGFTTTVADIGDSVAFDLQIDESYSTDTRASTWDDCHLDDWSYKSGSPGQLSCSISVGGPVVIDAVTYIAAR